MKLLERKYWWFWLLLTLTTGGAGIIALACLTDSIDCKAWYMKGKNWLIGLLCLFYPVLIMFVIFQIVLYCNVAANLEVPGKEIYLSPYIWIICLIVPVIGWIMFIVMLLYIEMWTIVSLYKGNGEKYIG